MDTKRATIERFEDGTVRLTLDDERLFYGGVTYALRDAERHFAEPAEPAAVRQWQPNDVTLVVDRPGGYGTDARYAGVRVTLKKPGPHTVAPVWVVLLADGAEATIWECNLKPLPADACPTCGKPLGDTPWEGTCWACFQKAANDKAAKEVVAAVKSEMGKGHTVWVHMCEHPAPLAWEDGAFNKRYAVDDALSAPRSAAGKWLHVVSSETAISVRTVAGMAYHAANIDKVQYVVPAVGEQRVDVPL